ncbi:unnamed protein product, partial [Ectocarpus sp. 13 AM-2016]
GRSRPEIIPNKKCRPGSYSILVQDFRAACNFSRYCDQAQVENTSYKTRDKIAGRVGERAEHPGKTENVLQRMEPSRETEKGSGQNR